MNDLEVPTTPAVWYARIFGLVLTLAGIVGLFVTTQQDATAVLAGLEINLMHNLVHLLTGVAGLAVGFLYLRGARLYALVLGVVYILVGILGTIDGQPIVGDLFHHINGADNGLHFAIGVLGVLAGLLSRDRERRAVVR